MAVMMVATLFAIGPPSSLARADYCEVVACWPECRRVPGGRWCHTVCRRRCWREPAPSYDPEPHYIAPTYAPTSTPRGDPLIALSVLAGLGITVLLIVAGIAAAGNATTDDVHAATDETERQTAETKALVADAEAKAREIDAHLDRFLADTQHPPRR
jgi:hypothetical protein